MRFLIVIAALSSGPVFAESEITQTGAMERVLQYTRVLDCTSFKREVGDIGLQKPMPRMVQSAVQFAYFAGFVDAYQFSPDEMSEVMKRFESGCLERPHWNTLQALDAAAKAVHLERGVD